MNKDKEDSMDLESAEVEAFRLLDGWTAAEPPPEFPERIGHLDSERETEMIVSASSQKSGTVDPLRRWLPVFVAAATLMLVVALVGRTGPEDPRESVPAANPAPTPAAKVAVVITTPVDRCELGRRLRKASKRYPFAETTEALSLEEFGALFGPAGLVTGYYGTKEATEPRAVALAARAGRISKAMFDTAGNPNIGLTIRIRATMPQTIPSFIFDGETIKSDRDFTMVRWPGDGPTTLGIKAFGAQAVLSRDGPWALFMIVRESVLSMQHDVTIVTVTIEDLSAQIHIRPSDPSVPSPVEIATDLLGPLQVPASLTDRCGPE